MPSDEAMDEETKSALGPESKNGSGAAMFMIFTFLLSAKKIASRPFWQNILKLQHNSAARANLHLGPVHVTTVNG